MKENINELITLNGQEYILYSKYKEKIEQDYKKISWVDPANVLAMFIAYPSTEDTPEIINFSNLTFKKVDNLKVTLDYENKEEYPSIWFNDTKYSKEYINLIEKRGKILTKDKPKVFMSYDLNKKEFKKNEPICFLFENVGFILAPRVDNETSN